MIVYIDSNCGLMTINTSEQSIEMVAKLYASALKDYSVIEWFLGVSETNDIEPTFSLRRDVTYEQMLAKLKAIEKEGVLTARAYAMGCKYENENTMQGELLINDIETDKPFAHDPVADVDPDRWLCVLRLTSLNGQVLDIAFHDSVPITFG